MYRIVVGLFFVRLKYMTDTSNDSALPLLHIKKLEWHCTRVLLLSEYAGITLMQTITGSPLVCQSI